VVFGIRVKQPQSGAGRIWNRGQDACIIFTLAAVALKLAGLINWSWWWVTAPVWVEGVLAVVVICLVLVLPFLVLPRRYSGQRGVIPPGL
jgi:sterol desaturase/sphingolipid hydroxylase (fatty acid hydroxylase superfamily)